MGIAEKKREILRLVEQLHAQSKPTNRNRKSNGGKVAFALAEKKPIVEKPATIKKELKDFPIRDPVEERLQAVYRQLDERIKNIEDFIQSNFTKNERGNADPKSGTNVATNDRNNSSTSLRISQIGSDSSNTGGKSLKPGSTPEREYSLGGKIQEGILPDILQLVSSNNKTGIFSLEHNSQKIDLYFDEGSLYHAKTDNMVGQNAFFAAMALEGGRFYFVESDDIPSERTIDGNTQFMILEALRQIDEQRNE